MSRICILVFLVFTSPVLLGQSSLEYKLKEGDKFVILQESVQHISQQFSGVTQEMDNIINGKMEFEVAAVMDDHYEVNMKFLDLGMRVTSAEMGDLMVVNAKEVVEGDIQSRIFNSMLNVPIRLVLAKSGNIIEVTGGDDLISKMADAAGFEDVESRLALETSLRQEFGSEALSASFMQMTYIYPDSSADQEGKWTNEYSGKLSAKNTWSLVSSDQGENQIEGKADIVLVINDPGTAMVLNGTQSTKITAQAGNGFIREMFVEGFSEGVATTTATGDLEIPTTVASTTTYKLIE